MATVATVNTNARQEAQLDDYVGRINAATCASVGLPPGSSDTAVKAINPNLTIWADRNAFFSNILKDLLVRTKQEYLDETKRRVAAALDAATNTQKNQIGAVLNAVDSTIPASGFWP